MQRMRVPAFMERLAASGWCNQSGCAHTESMRAAAKLVAEPLWMQSRVEIYVEYFCTTLHELIFLCRILQTVTNGSQPPMQVRHSDRIHCRQREGFGRVSSSCSRNWKGLLVLYNFISVFWLCLRSPPTKPGRSSIHTLHTFTCNMAPLRSYTARDLEGKRTCTGWIAATSTAKRSANHCIAFPSIVFDYTLSSLPPPTHTPTWLPQLRDTSRRFRSADSVWGWFRPEPV